MHRVTLQVFVAFVLFLSRASGKSADELVEEGNTQRFAGDQDAAIALYDQAIALSPSDAEAYKMRAFSYGRKNDMEKALADFRRAVQFAPNDSIFHNNLANAPKQQGSLDEARAEYDQAIRLDVTNIEAFMKRGKLRYDREDYGGAISDLTNAASIKPPYPTTYKMDGFQIDELALIYKLLGDTKMRSKDYNGAKSAYTSAISETHKYPAAYEGRADANDALGKAEDARQDRHAAKKIRDDPNRFPEMDVKHLLKRIFP